jgi:hypothetical protein
MPNQTRPALSPALSPEEFRAWYWLKSELVEFCRSQKLQTGSSKRELEGRILGRLSGKAVVENKALRSKPTTMPAYFTMETVIGRGWRCNPPLGAFFREALGNGFHFNAETRDFIHNGEGKTLAEAAICYQNSVAPGRKKSVIPQQLEYNRHFREYFAQNPGATLEEATAAWWATRNARRNPASVGVP